MNYHWQMFIVKLLQQKPSSLVLSQHKKAKLYRIWKKMKQIKKKQEYWGYSNSIELNKLLRITKNMYENEELQKIKWPTKKNQYR